MSLDTENISLDIRIPPYAQSQSCASGNAPSDHSNLLNDSNIASISPSSLATSLISWSDVKDNDFEDDLNNAFISIRGRTSIHEVDPITSPYPTKRLPSYPQ